MSKQRHLTKGQQHRKPSGRGKGRAGVPMYVWIGLGVVALIAAAILLLRPRQTLVPEITVAQAHEKYQQGAFFLDVRTQAEYDEGHIAKSVLIPLEELPNRLSDVPRDRDVVVVCRSGTRAREGGAILLQAGYTRVSCMSGGIQAWTNAGYPVEQ